LDIGATLADQLTGAVNEDNIPALAAFQQVVQDVVDRPVIFFEDGPFGSNHE